MHPRLWFILLALAAAATTAGAGVPSAANSTLPACLALCPMGDLPVTFIVRDLANVPMGGSVVVLDFALAPGAWLCPASPDAGYTLDPAARTLRQFTGPDGSVTFRARVGGIGPAGSVRVFGDGVFLGQYALASPDQDGNGAVLSVIGADDAIFAAKLGSHDPTADFDCSGTVDVTDEQVFFMHHSHFCDGFVDATVHRSWGQLKLHYR